MLLYSGKTCAKLFSTDTQMILVNISFDFWKTLNVGLVPLQFKDSGQISQFEKNI